jgi:hypothetical protein
MRWQRFSMWRQYWLWYSALLVRCKKWRWWMWCHGQEPLRHILFDLCTLSHLDQCIQFYRHDSRANGSKIIKTLFIVTNKHFFTSEQTLPIRKRSKICLIFQHFCTKNTQHDWQPQEKHLTIYSKFLTDIASITINDWIWAIISAIFMLQISN